MSGTENNWEANKQNDNNNKKDNGHKEANSFGGVPSILASLLGEASVLSNHRNMPEVADVSKIIKERIEELQGASLSSVRKSILPSVTILTNNVSSALPGLCLSVSSGNTTYIMPVLFSNKDLTNAMEDIHLEGQNARRVSTPFTPTNYVTKELISAVTELFLAEGRGKNINNVAIINCFVVDVEMYHGEDITKDGLATILANTILPVWEDGFLVTACRATARENNIRLPSPFIMDKKAYGPSGMAIARVEAVPGSHVRNGVVTGSNLCVKVVTTNQQNQGQSSLSSSKEVCTVYGTVTLRGQYIQTYQMPANGNVPQEMNYHLRIPTRPMGYYPLYPVVLMDYAKPGETMGSNGGLHSFFMGLYTLLTCNNNYLFSEAFRSKNVGSRGNLSNIETRVLEVTGGEPRSADIMMTEQRIMDSQFVNNWIHQNIAPRASFGMNISEFGNDAAIANFFMQLTSGTPEAKAERLKTIIAVIDSMTDNKFSELLKDNVASGKGWNPNKPILYKTKIIAPQGTAKWDGKTISLSEVDEMMICKIFPKDPVAIQSWLALVYGVVDGQDEKSRRYNIRQRLNEMFDGAFHINTFANQWDFNPEFVILMGAAMDTIGSLNVTGSMGTFASTPQAYAPGVHNVVMGAAGNVGGIYQNGTVVGNGSAVLFTG